MPQTETTTTHHGHAIMQLIAEHNGQWTCATLKSAVSRQLGAEARFHTCAAEALTFDQLIEFLTQHGKVQLVDGKLHLTATMCEEE